MSEKDYGPIDRSPESLIDLLGENRNLLDLIVETFKAIRTTPEASCIHDDLDSMASDILPIMTRIDEAIAVVQAVISDATSEAQE